jgi:hypothetical protein
MNNVAQMAGGNNGGIQPIQPIGGAAKQSALAEQGQSFRRSADKASLVSMILVVKHLRQGQ